jgi:hypothetical protein
MTTKIEQYQAALTLISVAVKAYATEQNRVYWTGLIDTARGKTLKVGSNGGDVQATLSDPLAYFVVPAYAWNCFHAKLQNKMPRGRTMEETMGQLVRVLKMGLTNRADKVARVATSLTVEELMLAKQLAADGYALAFLKAGSHNKEVRESVSNWSRSNAGKKAATRTAPATVPAASRIKLID